MKHTLQSCAKGLKNDHKQTTTDYQQTNTNYQQTTTNGHPWTSNQKSYVLFLLPTPGNYKEHPDFEKHTLDKAKKFGGGGGVDKDVKY